MDGTLAYYEHWEGPLVIGKPIEPMVTRVQEWLAAGFKVKIFTARAYDADKEAFAAIEAWCVEHIGQKLPVTCIKDMAMMELWDDRAVQVEANTGKPIGYSRRGL